MINKQFELVDKSDIEALVRDKIPEKKTTEYKEMLSVSNDKDRKEILADVSSFANALGGDIIFGVREKRDRDKTTGIPEATEGLPNINGDEEVRRLESMIRDGIAPRITGVQAKVIDGFSKGPVLVLRIWQSWSAPH